MQIKSFIKGGEKMKRILSAFLAVLFAISLAGFASAADMSTPAPVKKHHRTHKKKAPTATAAPKAPAAETTEPPASTK